MTDYSDPALWFTMYTHDHITDGCCSRRVSPSHTPHTDKRETRGLDSNAKHGQLSKFECHSFFFLIIWVPLNPEYIGKNLFDVEPVMLQQLF